MTQPASLIRPATLADVAAIARVHVDAWRTTYPGIVPSSYLEQMTYSDYETRWQRWLSSKAQHHHVYVAEQAGEVIGFANGGADRTQHPVYQGELYAVYILQGYQRQGYGRQLVGAIATQLKQSGFASMLVWALIENPACYFYQNLGGQPLQKRPFSIGGKDLTEIAFGWLTIETLIQKTIDSKNH